MKMAQVEFVGVLSTVLQDVRIHPAIKGDDNATEKEAREAVMRLLRDTGVNGTTLSLNRPEEVCLRISQR